MNKLYLRAKLSETDTLNILVKYEHLDYFSNLVTIDTNLEKFDSIDETKYSVQVSTNNKLTFINEITNDKQIFRKDDVDCSDFMESVIEQLDENENIEIIGRYSNLSTGSCIIYFRTLNTISSTLKNSEYIVRYDSGMNKIDNIFLYSNKELKEKKIIYNLGENSIKEVFNVDGNMEEVQFDIENNKIKKVLYRDVEFSQRFVCNRFIQHITSVISSKILTGDPIYEGSFVGSNSDETVHVFVSKGESLKSFSPLNKIYTVVKIKTQNEFKNMIVSDYYDVIDGELSIQDNDVYMTIDGMSIFSTLLENRKTNINLTGVDFILKDKFNNDNVFKYKEIENEDEEIKQFTDYLKKLSKDYSTKNSTEDVCLAAILEKSESEQYLSIADIYGSLIGITIERQLFS